VDRAFLNQKGASSRLGRKKKVGEKAPGNLGKEDSEKEKGKGSKKTNLGHRPKGGGSLRVPPVMREGTVKICKANISLAKKSQGKVAEGIKGPKRPTR